MEIPVTILNQFRKNGIRYFQAKTPDGWPIILKEGQVKNGKVNFDDLAPDMQAKVSNLKDKFRK